MSPCPSLSSGLRAGWAPYRSQQPCKFKYQCWRDCRPVACTRGCDLGLSQAPALLLTRSECRLPMGAYLFVVPDLVISWRLLPARCRRNEVPGNRQSSPSADGRDRRFLAAPVSCRSTRSGRNPRLAAGRGRVRPSVLPSQ